MQMEKRQLTESRDMKGQAAKGSDTKQLADRYFEIFQEYLRAREESSLSNGYEFARRGRRRARVREHR